MKKDSKLHSIETPEEKVGRIVSTAGLKTITSCMPVIGPILETVISETLPDRRFSRTQQGLTILEERLEKIENYLDFDDDENLGLLEEGIHQLSRALSDGRRQHIAELISAGLSSKNDNRQKCRHFLRILNQLEDEDIALLASTYNGQAQTTSDQLTYSRRRFLMSWGLIQSGGTIDGDKPQVTKHGVTASGEDFLQHLKLI